jgi:hypothetical protein
MAGFDPTSALIREMQVAVALDGVTVSVSAGVCYIPGTGRIISDGTKTVTLPSSAPANTFYHLYAYADPTGQMALELSTIAPDAPYLGSARIKAGDSTRRYLATGRTVAVGRFRAARHSKPGSMSNEVRLGSAAAAGSIPVQLANAFTSSVSTTIDLSSVVPLTATVAIIQIANRSNRNVYVSWPDTGAASATNFQIASGPGSDPIGKIDLSAAKTFNMVLSTAGLLGDILGAILSGSVMVYLQGYEFDR